MLNAEERSGISILDAMDDARLFAPQFAGESWAAWRSFLRSLFGLRIDGDGLSLHRECTGLEQPRGSAFTEAYAIVGRRGGKSRVAALVGVFVACFRDYSRVLSPGERAVVMILAPDRRQAQVVMGYVRALLDVPLLRGRIVRELRESIDLTNNVSIEVHTASFRAVRGYSLAAVIADEMSFWRDEATANPDVEIVRAVRPGLATIPGSLLLGISSPYSRRGALWDAYKKHHGKESGVLVWLAHGEDEPVSRSAGDRGGVRERPGGSGGRVWCRVQE